MRIAIISQSPNCYSTRRLVETADRRGHDVEVLDTSRFTLMLERGRPWLLYREKSLEPFDAVVPRIGASVTFFGTAVVRQFEQMGVYCLNCAESIVDARDKLRCMQLLSRHDIGIPATSFVRNPKHFLHAIESVGGAPVILKLLQGTQGVGVILADTIKVAQAILETLRSARQNVLIQKFVAESKGRDIRALVVGDRVVAAMRRTAQGLEFRSNVHRGGVAEKVKLDANYTRTAIRAAHVLGLDVAGVDMLEGEHGPLVSEVNACPGIKGLENATKVDVADNIFQFLEAQLAQRENGLGDESESEDKYDFREIDIRANSELVGQSVSGPRLSGAGLLVLKLIRNVHVIERPDASVIIRPGDKLLCFGRTRELSGLHE
jgi:ribosomal protein S6--L-glutamate ligase